MLADAIARLDPERLPDEEKLLRAHARLIRGTSFDLDPRQKLRTAEELCDLAELFDKLVGRVRAAVDLDACRDLVKRIPARIHPLWPERGKILPPETTAYRTRQKWASGLSHDMESVIAEWVDADVRDVCDHASFGTAADLIDFQPYPLANWWGPAIPSVPLATGWLRYRGTSGTELSRCAVPKWSGLERRRPWKSRSAPPWEWTFRNPAP